MNDIIFSKIENLDIFKNMNYHILNISAYVLTELQIQIVIMICSVFQFIFLKRFPFQEKLFQKQYFLNIFLLFDFCQDHDSHKGSNWNLFPNSTTLRKREHGWATFTNVKIGLFIPKEEFKILHLKLKGRWHGHSLLEIRLLHTTLRLVFSPDSI